MNDLTDQQLLRDYAERQSETAFAELVRRHVDLIYSAALRMVCDSHLAKDVTQAVFLALAQNARQLTDRPVLSGWLHRTAQNIASKSVRTEVRRRAREQEAAAMNELLAHEPDATWENIAPHLDTALGELSEPDRDALLLRYFERKSAREMAQTLGTSEEAAQKRVNRAVERLREFFSKRNVTVGTSGLVVVISTNAVQAAPVGLIVTISSAISLVGATVQTSTAIATTKAIAMTTLQKTLITATITVAVGAGIYEAHKASQLKEQIQMLKQRQTPLAEQTQQLQMERDEAIRQLASLGDENERLNRNSAELVRLRGEVSLLRGVHDTLANSTHLSALPTGANTNENQTETDIGRELGLAVVRGEAGALNKVAELSRAALKSFNAGSMGLNDTERSALASRTFAPLHAAFRVIGEAAGKGNQAAIEAVENALQIPELKGSAVKIVGTLAGMGNEAALEMLLEPDKYGILLSSSVFALRSAAEAGNPKAIAALSAIANDERKQPLWFEAANGLATAAESGNTVAVEALVSMSSSTNQNIRNAVVLGLKRAAANQNAKASETLRSMGVQ